ncbi:DUF7282 domain-containing protein [Pseudoroseicyclus aestuarii]|uniref:DUF7282 domain-containing protein n=1 Tax=Pseudoroseicyclus aestuarii TaxID=1795041 RepID=A0A318SQD0_9RHOB|nr:hypothetical protein [Pseudoroseicyclus aestuarii]PYE84080.1 hypothetical protein DFP88_103445 [Pseudoroseicyclus aestuarii]
MFKILTTTACATALLTGAAAAQETETMETEGMSMTTGSTVVFPSVTASSSGYIVIHETENGELVVPQSIGHAPVSAGANADVSVMTDVPLTPGAEYIAMLHEETNGNDTYDFGVGSVDVDTPVLANGAPVTVPFTAPMAGEAMGDETAMAEDADDMADEDMSAGGDMDEGMETDAPDATSDMEGDSTDAALDTPLLDLAGMSASAQTVTVPTVVAAQDGYIVLHATDAEGAPVVPQSLGSEPVAAGMNEDVTITTDEELVPGARYIVMLHAETNGNGTYDFGEGSTDVDTPVVVDGAPLMVPFDMAE